MEQLSFVLILYFCQLYFIDFYKDEFCIANKYFPSMYMQRVTQKMIPENLLSSSFKKYKVKILHKKILHHSSKAVLSFPQRHIKMIYLTTDTVVGEMKYCTSRLDYCSNILIGFNIAFQFIYLCTADLTSKASVY